MSEARRLLEQATPLPWVVAENDDMIRRDDGIGIYQASTKEGSGLVFGSNFGYDRRPYPDAELIAYAVNHLPDYEAAVDALERLSEVAMTEEEDWSPRTQDEWVAALNDAGTILRRLRGDAVPS